MITSSNEKNESLMVKKVAHYQILKKIGQGGMSTVYEAFDERLKRHVALKFLHPFLAEKPEYRARFFREAQACARLAHPNILQIFDISSKESSYELYIVTEFLTGGTLKERALMLDTFELPELGAMIIAQILQALEHAHKNGIIHRDIKPENIMLTQEGQIKLMDFGIASIGSEENLTDAGSLLGSLAHVAPEVIKGQKATIQSDLFSLSTVFYWLLTKELPFSGNSPHALLKSIVDAEPKKPQTISPFVSDSLSLIIEKGMEKDPKKRFKSAWEYASAIESSLLNMGVSADTKKLPLVLGNPQKELSAFKSMLLEQISAKKNSYEQQQCEALALTLQCRLDASSESYEAKTILKKKNHLGRVQSYFVIILIFLVFLIGDGRVVDKEIGKKTLEIPILASFAPEAKPEPDYPENPLQNVIINPSNLIEEKKEIHDQSFEEVNLEIVIWPFATVWINGKVVAKNTKSVIKKLKPGEYILTFTHPYAATVRKNIKLIGSLKSEKIKISMTKSKPSFLIVNSDIEADVVIDNQFKGSTNTSLANPIVILLPDKSHAITKEIIIQKQGFKPIIVNEKFIAGHTKTIFVKLVP